jgi:hypothetical protein
MLTKIMEDAMTKTFATLAVAATLAVGAATVPTAANAGCGWGCGIGIGVATGALIGAAAASSGPYYGGYYGYGPTYVAAAPCYWTRERFFDGYGWRFRRVRVCY